MEIKNIDASLPSIVSDVSENGRSEKREKAAQKEQAAQVGAEGQETQRAPAAAKFETISFKAFFAVDENKNVVIRIMDDEGNVVKQIPPVEYLKMAETLSESRKTLFHLEA